jgi:hypothetical protein
VTSEEFLSHLPEIKNLVETAQFDRWVEPFCGSCIVAPVRIYDDVSPLVETGA